MYILLLPGNLLRIENNKVNIEKYYDINKDTGNLGLTDYDPNIFKEILKILFL